MKKNIWGVCVLFLIPTFLFGDSPRTAFQKRYVLYRGQLAQPTELIRLLSVMRRASAAGYNGIVLEELAPVYLFLDSQSPVLLEHYSKIRQWAKILGLSLIPGSFFQYDPALKDSALGEGLPVKETPFVAQQGFALPVSDPALHLENGDFEHWKENVPTSWLVNQPGKIIFYDTKQHHGGTASLCIKDPGVGDPIEGMGCATQTVNVVPFRAYEVSTWIKTDHFSFPENVVIVVRGENHQQELYVTLLNVASTQDWTYYSVTFNSLSNSKVILYLGTWAKTGRGRIWFDDAEMHEVGLHNMIRSPSLPVQVKSNPEIDSYKEGIDYIVQDDRLLIPTGSKIRDGQPLRVSWYLRGDTAGTTPASACRPEFFSAFVQEAKNIEKLFGKPKGYLVNFDEWRVANWDPACHGKSASSYFAEAMRGTERRLKEVNPQAEVYVWSDMFDPYHNAQNTYFMVNGSLIDTWKGLSRDTLIMNWNSQTQLDSSTKKSLMWNSLRFFAKQNHRQIIAGYYDSIDNVRTWLDTLDSLEKTEDLHGIEGFMYTTWENDPKGGSGRYDDLELVAAEIKHRGRWGSPVAFP